MPVVIVAIYLAKPGLEEQVAVALREMAAQSREESGCLTYLVHQHSEDPRRFMIYKQYADEEAVQAHRNSAHFKLIAQERIFPTLEARDVSVYEVLSA